MPNRSGDILDERLALWKHFIVHALRSLSLEPSDAGVQLQQAADGRGASFWEDLSDRIVMQEEVQNPQPYLIQMRGELNTLRERLKTNFELLISDRPQILQDPRSRMGGRGGR